MKERDTMQSYTNYVDPFIGVDGPGNCLCGPYLPLSIVRLSPDTLPPNSTCGYKSEDPIVRFSHTHVSGTGGGGRYGNIGLTPYVGKAHPGVYAYDREAECAESGYYTVRLKPENIKVELTTTPRVGVHRYSFPDGDDHSILVDAGSVIQVGIRQPGEDGAISIGGYLEIVSDREVVGRGDFKGGWGHPYPYSVYFYARFDQPFVEGNSANSASLLPKQYAWGQGCRAYLNFKDARAVTASVGISYVSIAQAREHVAEEVAGKDFDVIRAEAKQVWENSLSRIDVEGGSEEQKKLFYTLFTRLICMPSDLGVDEENPYWKSGIRHFTDYYCLWDSVRNANSLITMFDPKLEVDMLNCLLDVAEHIGWLPDAWIAGHSAMVQGGSSADILFCEAHIKGLEGIDYEKALRYMRKNNEVESPDPWYFGRHLKDYRELGYLSTNVLKNSVSRHLEYAYQDHCIAVLAERLGHTDVAAEYYESSKKVWNLWRDDIKFFAPRKPDGRWVEPYDPSRAVRRDHWNDPYFYEGTGWQWSFSVQHDFPGLMQRYGGPEGFVAHLDEFFDNGHWKPKETMLHVPYLYLYAGRPDRTVERVRAAMERHFHTTRKGLSDNEDMGCQAAFYMCSAMGMYPLMGQDLYWLTTPIFTKTELQLGSPDKVLTIEAPEAGNKMYPRRILFNGQPLEKHWIRHSDIAEGGTLTFELGDTPGEV